MPSVTVSCSNVTKRFATVTAVADCSLEISPGICALLGPNGAGKSTLLELLTGLLIPSEGVVRICGLAPREARAQMGVMPEDLGLFDLLTVKEHFELTGPIYGLSRGETRTRAHALMQALGLDAAQDTFLEQCSHGTRKKTSLALALLHGPRVLFLDEPFEGIDPVSARKIQQLLQIAGSGGTTIFFTSHTLGAVEQIATRTIMMSQGKAIWDSASQASNRPLEELYFSLIEEKISPEELSWLRSSPS
jgi:ABC-2 type transport system ATP-binding protein